jgi:hypothetical protein
MSWWVMFTTEGRLLTNVQVTFANNELHVPFIRLQEGEDVAILLDTYHSKARIYRPFDECQRLASHHQYELFIKRQPEETFVSHIERLLQLRHPKTPKAGPSSANEEPALRDNASVMSLLQTEKPVPEQMPDDLQSAGPCLRKENTVAQEEAGDEGVGVRGAL